MTVRISVEEKEENEIKIPAVCEVGVEHSPPPNWRMSQLLMPKPDQTFLFFGAHFSLAMLACGKQHTDIREKNN